MRRSASANVLRPLVLGALVLASCEGCHPAPPPPEEEYDDHQLAPQVIEGPPPDPDAPAPPAIAENPVIPRTPDLRDRRPPPILPAHPDDEYAGEQPVRARRYVYGVRMIVPAALGDRRQRLAVPKAELFVDVSHDRLRARFAGAGWPVAAGSEIRLRRDRPGVYVFDGAGGRPLEPGEMASWFEGGEVTRHGPPLRVFANYGPARHAAPATDEDVPGELVCALLAEWAGEPRENVMRRCERGAPYLWRLGFWRAEQTADVPVDLPGSALRADEVDPPARVAWVTSRASLEPAALSRLDPRGHAEEPEPDAPAEGLRIRNESSTRVVVAVQGLHIGWVDAGSNALFVGLRPGVYEVGAIRPLGAVVQRGHPVSVPGVQRVCDGRCRREPAP